MLVSVKREHIDKQGKKPCDCPIALAIKDMPEFEEMAVEVWPGSCRIGCYNSDGRFGIINRYNLDILVTDWIMKYDDGKHVSPFTFDLDTSKDYARKDVT